MFRLLSAIHRHQKTLKLIDVGLIALSVAVGIWLVATQEGPSPGLWSLRNGWVWIGGGVVGAILSWIDPARRLQALLPRIVRRR